MSASDLARNRWPGILMYFGVAERCLSGKNVPCPACGGRDRFRFDDQEGRGTFFCSHCGAGDGFKLLMSVTGWGFKEAAEAVERIVGAIPAAPKSRTCAPTDGGAVGLCRRLWTEEARPVVEGDPVSRYLHQRIGKVAIPPVIRFHPSLAYHHDDGRLTKHPAMLAKVQGPDGKGVALHRTYLTDDGRKADVPAPKKIIGGLPPASAVRLSEPSLCFGIAEGIETALSAFLQFGVPTWSTLNANRLTTFYPPDGIEHLVIFADNDSNKEFTGQRAAFDLAARLAHTGLSVEVRVPDMPGADWNDILRLRNGSA